MNTTFQLHRRLPAAGLAALLALALPSVHAAGQTGGEATTLSAGNHPAALIIAHGDITLPDGSHKPATLGNVAEVIRNHLPTANLIMIGTADVVFDNLTLHWNADQLDQLGALLRALAVASGNQFTVALQDSGFTYVLASPESAHQETPRHVAVFNLAALRTQRLDLEQERHAAEDQIAELSQKYGDKHPELMAAHDRLKRLDEQLNQENNEFSARLNEIEQLVHETLHDLAIKETPSFRFHPSASLLIVIGSDEVIAVVQKIVTAMCGIPGSDTGRTRPDLFADRITGTNDPQAVLRLLEQVESARQRLVAATPGGPSGTASDATEYTVRIGDTLAGIAARTHTTYEALMTLNNLTGDLLHVGQKLQLRPAAPAVP